MAPYDHRAIEKKWQEKWEADNAFAAKTGNGEKSYLLIEFPYPSGAGLHTGHVRSYTAMDVVARKRRREGKNVLYPIGWDAFGLPTENYAIKTGRNPKEITKENTDTYRRQLKSLGISFDWDREVNTTDPSYYKWTQWIFLQLFKKGLAYKAKTQINWCPKDKIGLANEEVVDGKCERCGTEVEKREKEQWMLAITKYAQRLYDDLETVDYIERAKIQQRNWIGPSEGALLTFALAGITGQEEGKHTVEIFTTRPDTIFGATFVAVSPELASKWVSVGWQATDAVKKYITDTLSERAKAGRKDIEEKTGIDSSIFAVNPATGEKIPVWITNYVLGDVGTGAIMAVPAHDERDYDFARKFGLPIKRVVEPKFIATSGESAVQEGEFIKRNAICAVVRNPKDDTYLCISWKNVTMNGLVTGGIEEGEDSTAAARREILEETGYKNLKLIRESDIAIHSLFYHRIKKQNRWARFQYFLFDLIDEERSPIADSEAAVHEVVWKKEDELKDFFTVIEGDFILNLINNTAYIHTGEGVLHDSGEFTNMDSQEAKKKITEKLGGTWTTTYKLRDWVFSRQRYWGEPIPMVSCEKCGWVPVSEDQLPVTLPDVSKYEYTDTGESPLSTITEWVTTTCPNCSGPAKRETDVMPNWAGSSWYYLRYADPDNDTALASKEALEYWTPVDWYNGGMEHTVLHLLYSRFWHKFLFDIGVAPTSEPYQKRTSHGLILAEGGEKMSKSKGNIVNPDDIVITFGADALRTYEMFMGPFDQAIAWSTDGLVGAKRFLERVEALTFKASDIPLSADLEIKINQAISKVTGDIEALKMNTAISTLMSLLNDLAKEPSVPKAGCQALVSLMAPFAPHLAEELWARVGGEGSVHNAGWPAADPTKLTATTTIIAIQINGKLRGTIQIEASASEEEVKNAAFAVDSIKERLNKAIISRVVYVPGRLISIVTEGSPPA